MCSPSVRVTETGLIAIKPYAWRASLACGTPPPSPPACQHAHRATLPPRPTSPPFRRHVLEDPPTPERADRASDGGTRPEEPPPRRPGPGRRRRRTLAQGPLALAAPGPPAEPHDEPSPVLRQRPPRHPALAAQQPPFLRLVGRPAGPAEQPAQGPRRRSGLCGPRLARHRRGRAGPPPRRAVRRDGDRHRVGHQRKPSGRRRWMR
jgi:hypothetical protein